MKSSPPQLAKRFFSRYCRNHLHDSILGDLDEQFYQNKLKYGTGRSNLLYWLEVLRFINRFTLKKNLHSTSYNYYSSSMIKNNFISSLRFLGRNKGFAFINTFGLTLGFTSLLFVLFFVNHELSFDQFHTNKEQVFRVNFSFQDNAGNSTTLVNSPPALAAGVWGEFPELGKITRMRYTMNCLLSYGEARIYEDHGYYADSLFLEILQFGMLSGDPNTALDEPNSIVITEDMAHKYFNDSDPLGETLLFNNTIPLKVTGVLSSIPTNSHLNFDFLISFSTYSIPEGYSSDLTSWSWLGFLTYVELAPNADPKLFEKKLIRYFKEREPDDLNPMLPIVQNLSDIYLESNGMADDVSSHIRSGNIFSIHALMTVAALILLVAGFNFSNLTNALSLNRSRASGVRKVLGASKKSIIFQMLTESLLITFFCLILSFGVTLILFPYVSQFMGWAISLEFNIILKLVSLFVMAGIFIGIISGLYPALTLAEFDIIESLKGSLKIGNKGPFQLKNVLVMLQFAISIGLIAATIILTQQINFLRSKKTGYSSENVVLIKMLPQDMSLYFDLYKDDLSQQASVTSVSRSDRVIGDPWPWSIIRPVGEDPENGKRVFFNLVGYDYFETMRIPIYSGRSFSKEYSNDPTRAIIINQKAAEYMKLDDPIGKQVHFIELDGPRTIVGVTENFNYTSLHQEIGPTVVVLPFIDLEYMYVRFAPGNLHMQIEMLEDTWKRVSPANPLAWRFMNDDLQQLYHSEEKLSLMIQVFSVLTILLACLGLYGIVTFMINNRIKEFGIRKVLGASVHSLYILLVSKYIYQIILAMVIIMPLIHYLANTWLEDFAYHIQINWLIYPLAALAMIIITLITITFQILKAAHVNPTKLLRNE